MKFPLLERSWGFSRTYGTNYQSSTAQRFRQNKEVSIKNKRNVPFIPPKLNFGVMINKKSSNFSIFSSF